MPFLHRRVQRTSGGFGEALKELREQRGYSLEDVSRATGIHCSILQCLEDERVDDLIDPTYNERHVKTIVTLLEGQMTYFLEKYRKLLSARGKVQRAPILLPPRIRNRDLFVSSRVIPFVGFVGFTVCVMGYVLWQALLLSSKPGLTVSAPADGERLFLPSVDVVGETDPAAFVNVNGQQAVVQSDGVFHVTIDVPRGVTTLRIEAKRRYGSASILERHVMYERDAATTTDYSVPVTTSTSSTMR